MTWKQCRTPMLLGFLIGCLIGWIQPYTLGIPQPNALGHVILALEMGLAFALIAFTLVRYQGIRKRLIERLSQKKTR